MFRQLSSAPQSARDAMNGGATTAPAALGPRANPPEDVEATSSACTSTTPGAPWSTRTSARWKSRASNAGPAVSARDVPLPSGCWPVLSSSASHSVHEVPSNARTENRASASPCQVKPSISAPADTRTCWTSTGAANAGSVITSSWTPGRAAPDTGPITLNAMNPTATTTSRETNRNAGRRSWFIGGVTPRRNSCTSHPAPEAGGPQHAGRRPFGDEAYSALLKIRHRNRGVVSPSRPWHQLGAEPDLARGPRVGEIGGAPRVAAEREQRRAHR